MRPTGHHCASAAGQARERWGWRSAEHSAAREGVRLSARMRLCLLFFPASLSSRALGWTCARRDSRARSRSQGWLQKRIRLCMAALSLACVGSLRAVPRIITSGSANRARFAVAPAHISCTQLSARTLSGASARLLGERRTRSRSQVHSPAAVRHIAAMASAKKVLVPIANGSEVR